MNRLTITIAVIVLGGITILSLSGALQPSYGTDAGNLPEARTLIATTDESGSVSTDYTTGPQTAAAPVTAPESTSAEPEPAVGGPEPTNAAPEPAGKDPEPAGSGAALVGSGPPPAGSGSA